MVYGERVLPNLALSMSPTPLTLAANVLMAIHLLSAFVIIINPVCQEIEELYNVPRGLSRNRLFLCLFSTILNMGIIHNWVIS